jgi:hypothetical protein
MKHWTKINEKRQLENTFPDVFHLFVWFWPEFLKNSIASTEKYPLAKLKNEKGKYRKI